MERKMPQHVPLSSEQQRQLYGLLTGYRVSQAMYVVAKLDIAGLLADGPRAADDLARVTGTHPGALYRVLRFLSGVGLFHEVTPRHFALSPLGTGLRGDLPGSIRPTVLMLLDENEWKAWGDMLFSVQTGETAFEHVHGMGRFEYLRQHPEDAATFNAAMTSNTMQSGAAITQTYDFSGITHLVDVGGGHGVFLATILRAHPEMRGTLFDQPAVVAGADSALGAPDLRHRSQIIGGDFFAAVPAGADAYILRQIIHDWNDEQSIAILRNCRQSMSPHGRVLVVERRLDSDYRQALPALQVDLQMLVNLGGGERTEEEYRALFGAAGLQLTSIVPLHDAAQFVVFEGRPSGSST
jgi:hypothetical protein